MKQHITVEQLKELTKSEKDKLRNWWVPNISASDVIYNPDTEDIGSEGYISPIIGYYPILSIGQMIEFLDEHKYFYGEDVTASFWIPGLDHRDINNKMCDFLWEAVKEVLQND